MNDRAGVKVKHRDRQYAERYETRIWHEYGSEDNPFSAEKKECFGYSLEELVENVTYTDMIYLLVTGELPEVSARGFLNKLTVAFANPGVRHDATRAAVLGGVGKTLSSQVLPIGLLTYGGRREGVGQLDKIMKFIGAAIASTPEAIDPELEVQSFELAGYVLGGNDVYAEKIAAILINDPFSTPHLDWCSRYMNFVRTENPDVGWLKSTVLAAAFCDLSIPVKYAVGLAQMIAAPGLVAHGFEHSGLPTTVLPFIQDEAYELKK